MTWAQTDGTYVYDPTVPEWTELPVTGDPPENLQRTMYYPSRQSLIAWGRGRTWELKDGAWTEVLTPVVPPDRTRPALVSDPIRGTVILHGGFPAKDTWELAWRSSYPDEQCEVAGDDDGDGLADCDDPDCAGSEYCTAESDCADGVDNDGDLLVDCAEPECGGVGICEAFEQSCGDGQDNDGDGRIDCQDTDCFLLACPGVDP